MMRVGTARSRGSSESPGARLTRPVGRVARIVAGVALIAIPIASDGLAVADAFGALVVLPAIAVALDRVLGAGVARIANATGRFGSPAARTWMVHVSALALIILIATALIFVTAIDAGAIYLFFGVSFLVLAARGDAGCEALAIPNAILGRRDETGCIAIAVLDALEARAIASDSTGQSKGQLVASDASAAQDTPGA